MGNPRRGGLTCESVLSDGLVGSWVVLIGRRRVAILVLGEGSRQHVYASQGGDAIQRLALIPVNYGVQVRNRILRLVYQAENDWLR